MLPSTALSLLRRFEAAHDLRLTGLEKLAARIEVVELAPGAHVMRQGEPSPHVHVVRSGLLKQMYIDPQGDQWIKSFTGEGDLFACLDAMERRGPARFSSVAIEKSLVERIDYRWIEDIANRDLAWQKALRLAFQSLARIKVQREYELLALSPRELYARIRESSAAWLERVPQKDLAAFLGVTPVGLSRIARAWRPSAANG